jgi:hypothetical protein
MHRCLRNASFTYSPRGRGGAVGWFKGFDILGRRWGLDHSTVYVEEERYLDRWIVYLNGYTLRLHRFWRGDDDRASHSHPWAFVTFPLTGYLERLYHQGTYSGERHVKRWRFQYRPADFEHYVVIRADREGSPDISGTPWWTVVATGPKRDTWGFYPSPGKFVNYKDWT